MKEDSADEVLLTAARNGDHSAFLSIFQRHGTRVYKFLYRFLDSAKAAEDITHDSFLHLLRNPTDSRFADSSVLIQLYSTARKLAIERSQKYIEAKWPVADEEESIETVKRSIKALPPLERETLILFEYENLSIQDIAQIVEADEKIVRIRLNDARRKLREAMHGKRTMDTPNELK